MKQFNLFLVFIFILSLSHKSYSQGMNYYMDKRAQQYDLNYNYLKKQYDELMNLQLVNKINKAELENYKAKVKEWSESNFTKFDLSVSQNVQSISKYFTSWQTNKYILEEKSLLNNIQSELNRIKMKEPDTFYKSDRYKEIAEVLTQLADCQVIDINGIAWKHGFI